MSGCGHSPAKQPIEVVETKIPVKVACIDKVPEKPILLTGKGDYPGGIIASKDLIFDFEAMEKYATDWEVAAAGCIKKPDDK